MKSSRHTDHEAQAADDDDGIPPRKRPPVTASGGSNGGGGLRAGENVICKISRAEPGGYAVTIPKYNLNGFLPTENKLKQDRRFLSQ